MGSTATRMLLATLFLTCSLSASTTWAHAHLKQQTPAADSDVTPAPQSLTLHFSEGVESRFSGVTVTGPKGETVKTGKAERSETDKTMLSVAINQPLTVGRYHVSWHVVSVDGHKTHGQYHFSVK